MTKEEKYQEAIRLLKRADEILCHIDKECEKRRQEMVELGNIAQLELVDTEY